MRTYTPCIMVVLAAACAAAPAQELLRNEGFEAVHEVKGAASSDVGFGIWKVTPAARVPDHWVLNSGYPGELSVLSDGPHSGKHFVRIRGTSRERGAHLFQVCRGVASGKWYRVSLWARRGQVAVQFYQYLKPSRITGQTVIRKAASADRWEQAVGFYRAPTDGFRYAALALAVDQGQAADIDDVRIEEMVKATAPKGLEPVTLENELLRMKISPIGTLEELVSKASGKNFAVPASAVPMFQASRDGGACPVSWVKRQGDLIVAQFVDSDVKVSVKVAARKRYFTFEVVDFEPADVEWLSMEFPVKRLKTSAWSMNGTHDEEFGICHMGLTVNTLCRPADRGVGVVGLQAQCFSRHGIKGATTALIASPFDQYLSVIQEMEKDAGLPCPMLDGKWARISEPVRRSYLFATGLVADDVDALIEAAQVGHFGAILFARWSWRQTAGHYRVNTRSFPGGRAGLKQACDKIHAAGLKVGVHLFGPSATINDPYVTPVPDDRLMYIECPALATAIDAKAKTLVLEAPADLPPRQKKSRDPLGTFPGYYLRVGDELIRYSQIDPGPPYRFTGCQRGAAGTPAAAHPAGTPVRSLALMWELAMFDPDSTLVDEAAGKFAEIVNDWKLDMVYFDGCGCIQPGRHFDLWYYMNKSLLAYYRKFDHDVLFQTSMGPGQQLWWHMIPRSASADGHGDIKAYLDERLPGILRMKDNFTAADIGWYGLDAGRPPDQLEYICGKCLGCDGSISVQANRKRLETHPRARETMEMIGRYERCRLANHFPESVKAKLREKGKEFKLFDDGKGGWKLFRAAYGDARSIVAIDGKANVWAELNGLDHPCRGAVEILREGRHAVTADYDDPSAVVIDEFDDVSEYAMSEWNQYEKFVVGGGKVLTPQGPVRQGVSQAFSSSAQSARSGKSCAVYTARNATESGGGWSGVGRHFPKPLDLTGYEALVMWVHGDGKGEVLRVHFHDVAGRYQDLVMQITYRGWRRHTFARPVGRGFDWTRTEYVVLLYNGIPANSTVSVMIDGLKAIRKLRKAAPVSHPIVTVNGQPLRIPVELGPGKCVTTDGLGGCTLWPGGMEPGIRVEARDATFTLEPGSNALQFSCGNPRDFVGDVSVRVIRLWPLEE